MSKKYYSKKSKDLVWMYSHEDDEDDWEDEGCYKESNVETSKTVATQVKGANHRTCTAKIKKVKTLQKKSQRRRSQKLKIKNPKNQKIKSLQFPK